MSLESLEVIKPKKEDFDASDAGPSYSFSKASISFIPNYDDIKLKEEKEQSSAVVSSNDNSYSSKESTDEENTFFQQSYVGNQFTQVTVKTYTSVSYTENPIENIKDIYKTSNLHYEKTKFHQEIYENIIKTCGKSTLEYLQSQYLAQLHAIANVKLYTCNACKYETINFENLQCHLMAIHGGRVECEVYRCDICQYEVSYKSQMVKHLGKHKIVEEPITKVIEKVKAKRKKAKVERFPCPLCHYQGKSEDKLEKHLSVHKDRSHCDLCSFQSKNADILQKHKDTHKKGKSFLCYMCPFTITNKATLGRHLVNVHKIANEASTRSQMCEYCSFSCSSRHHLKMHYLSHKEMTELKEEQIYKCSSCSYQTKYKSNIKLHEKIHKEPDFICEVCGFGTRRRKSYEQHLLTHKKLDEIEWFRCDICPYQARNKKLLTKHIRKGDHSGKRLLHVRNRDRIREAQEKGEPLEPLIKKYRIKKINGVPIETVRQRRPRDLNNPKKVRKPNAKPKQELVTESEAAILDDTLLVNAINFEFADLAAAVVKND